MLLPMMHPGADTDQTPLAREPGDDHRLQAVRTFADNVLARGRDHYGPTPTPLFVDGVNVLTLDPVEWVHAGQRWIVSNLASQQHLFRTFVGLSALTGDVQFRQAAEAATRFHFDHFLRPCGLPPWGGHQFLDLRTHQVVGEQEMHEFKCSYPYYDFLWGLDPKATERLIKAVWNAHVLDWRTLDMNRHGAYNRPLGPLWASEFAGDEPFFEAP